MAVNVDAQVLVTYELPRRDNRSHAVSEGRYRGSDLAVTAGELNAGAGGGRLGYLPAPFIGT